MCVLCMSTNINDSSYLEGLTRCELPKNTLEGTRRKLQTAQVKMEEKIRNIKVYRVTATSAGGAFIQLLYFSPGFTSLLLYIKNPSRPFESFYTASFITTHTCGIDTLFIKY
jgi:hypothetical protein